MKIPLAQSADRVDIRAQLSGPPVAHIPQIGIQLPERLVEIDGRNRHGTRFRGRGDPLTFRIHDVGRMIVAGRL